MVRRNRELALISMLICLAGASSLLSAADNSVIVPVPEGLDAQIATLRRQRAGLALTTFERLMKDFNGAQGSIDRLLGAAERLTDAELIVSDDPTRQVAVLERHLGRVSFLHMWEEIAFRSGRIPVSDFENPCKYLLYDAQIRLHDARLRLGKR